MRKFVFLLLFVLVPFIANAQTTINSGITRQLMLLNEDITNRAHAFLQAMDSSLVIDLTQNEWLPIENPTGTFFAESELKDFTTLGDTLVIPISGDYFGMFSLSITGGDDIDFEIRVSHDATVIAKMGLTIPKLAGSGNITLPFFHECSAGEKVFMEIRNLTNDTDATIVHAFIFIRLLHK